MTEDQKGGLGARDPVPGRVPETGHVVRDPGTGTGTVVVAVDGRKIVVAEGVRRGDPWIVVDVQDRRHHRHIRLDVHPAAHGHEEHTGHVHGPPRPCLHHGGRRSIN